MAPDHTYTVLPRPLPAETNLSAFVCVFQPIWTKSKKSGWCFSQPVFTLENHLLPSSVRVRPCLVSTHTHIRSPMMSWDPVMCWNTKHWPTLRTVGLGGALRFIRTLFFCTLSSGLRCERRSEDERKIRRSGSVRQIRGSVSSPSLHHS